MNGETTVACKICGQPYKVYNMYAGDQSACPSCRAKAEQNMRQGTNQKWNANQAFGEPPIVSC